MKPTSEDNLTKSYSPHDEMRKVYPLIPVNSCLILQILVLGVVVIRYYYKHRSNYVPLMYMIISVSDMVMSTGFLLQYLCLWLYYQSFIPPGSYIWLVPINITLLSIFYYSVTFYSTILAVCRTISILNPFFHINHRFVFIAVGFYPVFWLAFLSYDFYTIFNHDSWTTQEIVTELHYFLTVHKIGFEFLKNTYRISEKAWQYNLVFVCFYGVPFILPSGVTVICMLLQVRSLHRSPHCQRHTTVTILQLTVLFFVCNVMMTLWMVGLTIFKVIQIDHGADTLVQSAFSSTLPLIHSAFSPLIIILRSREFKKRLSKWRGGLSCSRNLRDDRESKQLLRKETREIRHVTKGIMLVETKPSDMSRINPSDVARFIGTYSNDSRNSETLSNDSKISETPRIIQTCFDD